MIIGKFVADIISKFFTEKTAYESLQDNTIDLIKSMPKIKEDIVFDINVACYLYKEAIVKFLSLDNKALKKKNIAIDLFPKSIEAKNQFYTECLQPENKVKSLGFTKEQEFTVNNNEFINYIQEVPEDNESKTVFYKVRVLAPVIENIKLQWKTKSLITNKSIDFYMEDDAFKKKIFSGTIDLKEGSTMVVEVVYEKKNDKKEANAVKVYSFNDINFYALAEYAEFEKKLPKNHLQMEMFE